MHFTSLVVVLLSVVVNLARGQRYLDGSCNTTAANDCGGRGYCAVPGSDVFDHVCCVADCEAAGNDCIVDTELVDATCY
ncbi:uncharacterized protein CC84DRAFT_896255 [Paraphaeosphaeria sporulosa]|uniref:Uncharacterized protein n=1 Tax=Paraphaeosphaeria sporulosa TaxID=1460663 RepID=A0A177C947_9PLEO|nr:uncharacterized protein CC84DRAFT_896255 [Paraphaeosphaeria sporulosa]OAG04274.1 hypothetical protein CC84DRAFT_896255 [Paraphaeosphaeria sporulosa]